MRKWFAGLPDRKSKKISQSENSIKFSKEIFQLIFPERFFRNAKRFFGGTNKFFSRKKGQSGVDKTRLRRLKRTPLQRWRYMLDKKKYAWPTYEVSREQEVKIGYFKLQIESLLNYFFPHLRSRSRKNPPNKKR